MLLKEFFHKRACKKRWREANRFNGTEIGNDINYPDSIYVGNESYGVLNVFNDVKSSELKIGNYCSIAANVIFLLGLEHSVNNISTFPFKVRTLQSDDKEAISKGSIIVEDDVWIGYGATIMGGVHICQGAVIAAGAVVTKDVPPYAIVGGVPAKIIKYRFSPEIINELMKVDYSKLTKEMIKEHIDDLYVELTDPKQVDWMPKKE